MQSKTKILTLAFLLLAPFYCQANIFNIDIPKIDTKKIMWDATCGLIQTKAQQKATNLKSKTENDYAKAMALYEKLRNIASELNSRGYPMQEIDTSMQKFIQRVEGALGYATQAVDILEQIKTDACRKDKVWTTNKLTEARNNLQRGQDYFSDIRHASNNDFFEALNELRDHRVRSNR
ncbi:MAG: hypothetical protein NTZ97_00355 [Candidatus Moranbacteria bacterium]|nr:hypothetical protein [Candidatus Moranbacteria bacterium]